MKLTFDRQHERFGEPIASLEAEDTRATNVHGEEPRNPSRNGVTRGSRAIGQNWIAPAAGTRSSRRQEVNLNEADGTSGNGRGVMLRR